MPLLTVNCCLVDLLLEDENNFCKLNLRQKKNVIEIGRSTPAMKIDYKRKDGVWSRTGYADINNLVNSAKNHVKTEKHIRSCLSLHELGTNSFEASLGDSSVAHNKKVDRNRRLMERFIDTVVLLGKQEQAFQIRGHNEKPGADNRGNYVETILYLSKYDTLIDSHLEQCSSARSPHDIFSGLSNDIQNDLIRSIAAVIKDEVIVEISETRFVSIVVDEIPDASHTAQVSAVLRYISDEGIEERFLGFFDVSERRNADELAKLIANTLDVYGCKEKLIGQSYDGGAAVRGEASGVKKEDLDVCPVADFIPCYSHVLNLVLSRSLESIPELKVFFGHINTVISFFNKSPKRSNILKQIASRRVPGMSEIRWHYHSGIVNAIFNCRLDIIETCNHILDSPTEWDNEALSMADSLLFKLEGKDFCFLLTTVSEIFAKTDALFKAIQNTPTDVEAARREIECFESWLCTEFLNEFDSIFESIRDCPEPPRKRRLFDVDLRTHYEHLFLEVKDNVLSQLKTRYKSYTDLIFLDLLNKSKYSHFAQSSPDDKISFLINFYPGIFDFTALKNELKVLYTTPSLQQLDVLSLHKHLRSEILRETFPQISKLSALFLTLPITAASVEESFCTHKRIHAYLRESQGEDRLSDLAVLSIEKRLLLKMKSRPSFYENVLAEFVKKDRSIDLEYN